jgi:sugar phosphate isomerase/epimerase
MKPTLSLSSCWCSHRHSDGYAMLQEMAGLGFDHVELSHGIRITLVPGILRGVEEGVIKVSSTHNFCPLPTGISHAAPNLFEPSSVDHQEHDQWLRHTKRSIEFADQVGARVVVCHLGSAKFFWNNPGRKLRRHVEALGGKAPVGEPGYQAMLAKCQARMRKKMGPFWERTQASIQEILPFAAERGVKLALENREKFEELPLDEDYPGFLKSLPEGAAAGYWHDAGHAQLKQGLGVLSHEKHLESLAGRLLGFHLHDVKDGDDHQPIGSGEIDWQMLSRFWRPEHLLVLELHPGMTVDDLRASKAKVEELLAARS